jgi:hypothetical protein
VSFIAGFALQDLRVTFGLYGAIVVLLALVSAWRLYPLWVSETPVCLFLGRSSTMADVQPTSCKMAGCVAVVGRIVGDYRVFHRIMGFMCN